MSAAVEHSLTTEPAAIERELRRLEEQDATSGQRPVRACMSNLIVYCDDEAQAARVPPELTTLVERHPARILLLIGESTAVASGIAAEVSALSYQGSGRRQVYAEHVRLGAAQAARRRLPATVRPLLVGDLPTTLWWATPEPPPASETFQQLASMADQVLYDSVGWREPARGVISAANWAVAARQRVADLAWSRNAPWRGLIAEVFDATWLRGGISAIREVEVEHGPNGLPQVWLLIGWLASCLGWRLRDGTLRPGVDITWTFDAGAERVRVTVRRLPEGSPRIRELSIRGGSGSAETVARITALDAENLSLCIEGSVAAQSAVAMRPLSPASLLASHLSERSIDPLFRDALASSRELAKAVVA